MHYYKGNPSKLPYLYIFVLFDPPKIGNLMTPIHPNSLGPPKKKSSWDFPTEMLENASREATGHKIPSIPTRKWTNSSPKSCPKGTQ